MKNDPSIAHSYYYTGHGSKDNRQLFIRIVKTITIYFHIPHYFIQLWSNVLFYMEVIFMK